MDKISILIVLLWDLHEQRMNFKANNILRSLWSSFFYLPSPSLLTFQVFTSKIFLHHNLSEVLLMHKTIHEMFLYLQVTAYHSEEFFTVS
jgi:hypothetical protein